MEGDRNRSDNNQSNEGTGHTDQRSSRKILRKYSITETSVTGWRCDAQRRCGKTEEGSEHNCCHTW